MKRTDIALLIAIAGVSILVAYFVANHFLGNVTEKGVKVQTIQKISTSITQPDPVIFNSDAINPAVEVNIGDPNATTTDTSTTATSK